MAVDKSFVVKNGLEVNSDLIVADANSKKVGIASTGPRVTLDVRGGIAATDINITGVATIATLEASAGDVNIGNLTVSGFSTLGGITVDQLTVSGVATFADLSYDEITGRNINITGIATMPVFVGLTSFNNGVEVTGISTYAEIDTTNLNVSGVGTIDVGVIQNAQVNNLNASGVTTVASLSVTGSTFERLTVNSFSNFSGITTIDHVSISTASVTTADVTTFSNYPNFTGGATVSGVVTTLGVNATGIVTASSFVGDGSQLTGLGVGIRTTGSIVGYGFTMLNFIGAGNTFAIDGSTVDISIAGGGGGSASIGVGSTPGDAFTGIVTAGNLWYNTGLGRLFIYYQDDNTAQWVDAAPFNVGIITQLGNIAFSTGTVNNPALSFGADSNSGFFAPADGSLAFASNAVGIVTFKSGGVFASTYFGDGSQLTGIDAATLKSGGVTKAEANPNGVIVTGVLTATSFEGNGANLTNLPAGLGTALSSDTTSALNKIYFTDQVLGVASTITIDPPNTAIVAYTQYAQVMVDGDADLIVADGDEFIPNILGIGSTGTLPALGKSGGRIRSDNFADAAGTGAPEFTAGLRVVGVITAANVVVSGVLTATSFSGNVAGNATGLSGTPDITVGDITASSGDLSVRNITGVAATFTGNVSIAGTLTYQDVTNIDSVGIITAQQGIQVLANGLNVTSGVVTSLGYAGNFELDMFLFG